MSTKPVTEVAELALKPGVDYSTSAVFNDAISVLLSQPGIQRAYYSPQVESPNILTLFIDWDSVDAHIAFTKDPSYPAFLKNLAPLLDATPALTHAALTPHPPTAALSGTSAPATEVFFCYFDPALSDAEASDAEARLRTLATLVPKVDALRGISQGWMLEEQVPPGQTSAARVFLSVIGWDSVQAHMDFRETPLFQEVIPSIRGAPKLVATRVYHVQNQDA